MVVVPVVVVVDVSRVVEVDDVVDEDVDEDEDDVVVVDVVVGGMQQLLESHVQLSFDTYRSLQSCEFVHIIVTLEQFPPTWGHMWQGPYFK